MTEVKYHRDGYGPGRPAINVKLHVAGIDLHSPEVDRAFDEDEADKIHEIAYESVVADFWDQAAGLARQWGLGEIEQEGRTGGWLVLPGLVNRLPCPDHEDGPCDDELEALAAYKQLDEWVDEFLRDAPARVREKARAIAIDQKGERAARRLFGVLS